MEPTASTTSRSGSWRAPSRHGGRRACGVGALALGACLLTTGALAAGASALTGGGDGRVRDAAPPKPRTNVTYTERGTPYARDGHECEAGKRFDGRRKGERRSSDLRD